jgi:gamma-glutamylputrescine oxidase
MNAHLSYAGTGDHTTSYYAASANTRRLRPAVEGDHMFDVCVVGAGYSGLSTALHLAERGHNVVIVEGARIGWGASGRNGGQVVNGLNASLQTIKRRYGTDTANFVAGQVMEGGEIIRERIKTYDIQCDYKPTNLFTACTDAHLRELEERLALWQGYGIKHARNGI